MNRVLAAWRRWRARRTFGAVPAPQLFALADQWDAEADAELTQDGAPDFARHEDQVVAGVHLSDQRHQACLRALAAYRASGGATPVVLTATA